MENRKAIYMPPVAEMLHFTANDVLSLSPMDDTMDDGFDAEEM